jgi:murein DD-endopeptidase MepM/ murein hydrolase activator NlpD
MSPLSSLSRGLAALALVLAVSVLSTTAAVAAPTEIVEPVEAPQSLSLLAPFACGTEWRGSTYPGHGSHNWNLDLNRGGDQGGSDLGQPLFAQDDGVVVWFKQTGYNNRAGTYVEIDYGDVTVRYIHLVSGSIPEAVAEIGAPVTSGQFIGELGATGRVSGPHLHLEYWDSAGLDDTPWYQLPRANHLPVAFDGQLMVATPGSPSETAISTNCDGDALGDPREVYLERWYMLLAV